MNLVASRPAAGTASGGRPAAAGPDQATRLRALMLAIEGDRAGGARREERVESAHLARSARVLVVASGKGGVGKTNLAVNLSIALAAERLRVVLLDADLGVANADVLCGLHPSVRLDRVLGGRGAGVEQIAIDAPGGFRLVPGVAGMLRAGDLSDAGRDALVASLADLDRVSDVIVVDASPGVGPTVTGLLAAADVGVVVTTPEPTAIADAYALIKCCVHQQPGAMEGLTLVVNSARDRREAEATRDRLEAVSRRFLGRAAKWGGWVVRDEHVPAAVCARRPVLLRSPGAPASRAIRGLAATLAGSLIRGPGVTGVVEASRDEGAPRAGWLSRLGRAIQGR